MSRATKDYNAIDWSSLFTYDPFVPTGLRWKIDRMRGRWMNLYAAHAGDEAGCIHVDTEKNYRYCTVPHGGTNWFAARVIWIMHNGYLDKEYVIDHIDGNTLNNSLENLRCVRQAVNNRNSSKRKDNTTGICGVNFTTARGKNDSVHTYSTATWYDMDGKRITKHFAVSKYGLLPSFVKACEYRLEGIDALNKLGQGYTNKHGE